MLTQQQKTVKSGNYKVSRPFNICYKEDKLSDIDKDFISFIMSKEGQQIVNDNGYIGVEATESYKASGKKGKITLAGSTSVAPLMDKLKDEYVKLNATLQLKFGIRFFSRYSVSNRRCNRNRYVIKRIKR